MGEQVQRLTKLATDLLDLSRLDAGGLTVAHDEIELGELAADSAREMQALAARRGSSIVVADGRARAPARGDEGRVLQVLRVLLDNALRHTPPGSIVTLQHRDDALGRERGRRRRRARDPAGAPRARLRALLPRRPAPPRAAPASASRSRASWPSAWTAGCWPRASPGGTRFTLELPGPR